MMTIERKEHNRITTAESVSQSASACRPNLLAVELLLKCKVKLRARELRDSNLNFQVKTVLRFCVCTHKYVVRASAFAIVSLSLSRSRALHFAPNVSLYCVHALATALAHCVYRWTDFSMASAFNSSYPASDYHHPSTTNAPSARPLSRTILWKATSFSETNLFLCLLLLIWCNILSWTPNKSSKQCFCRMQNVMSGRWWFICRFHFIRHLISIAL